MCDGLHRGRVGLLLGGALDGGVVPLGGPVAQLVGDEGGASGGVVELEHDSGDFVGAHGDALLDGLLDDAFDGHCGPHGIVGDLAFALKPLSHRAFDFL